MKQCLDCAKEGTGPKPLSEFNKDSRAVSGLNSICRAHSSARLRTHYRKSGGKYNEQKKTWRRENPIAARQVEVRKYLRHTYGISEAQYTELFVRQGCSCAICHAPLKSQLDETREFTQRVRISGVACVDHCHQSGQIRGLLCFNCNIILGKAKDREQVLLNAARYLRENVTAQAQSSGPRKSLSEIEPGNRDLDSNVRRGSRRDELSPL